jgi:hypothetical protein
VSTLTQIHDGLATALRTIASIDQNVHSTVRRPPHYPAVILIPPAIPDYGLAIDGQGGDFVVGILVLAGTADAEQQATLWPYLDWAGPSSIPAAIQASRNLGLSDVDARVRSSEPPGLIELPDGTLAYGVQLNVGILAS